MRWKTILVSDLHLGLRRRSMSSSAFDALQFEALDSVIADANELRLPIIVLGDIFDRAVVDYSVLWRAVEAFSKAKHGLTLVRGNHDIGGNQEKMTAFDMLCLMVPGVTKVSEPTLYEDYVIVPHAPNQDVFDKWLEQASGTLLTHANYNSFFAVDQDHSLNITPGQAARFDRIISGHEHEPRRDGNVTMLGALLPCNITEAQSPKGYHIWDGQELEFVEVWSPEGSYTVVDWRSLPMDIDADFVRVVGDAEFDQGAQVIQAIAEFRKTSNAYFISNSVKVGELVLGELDVIEADLDGFDPLAVFWEILSKESAARIKEILLQRED